MTISEFLKSIGIPDDKVQDAEGKMKSYLDGDYVTKARFNELNESKKSLAEQITERDKQLKDLKKSVGDNEDLRKQIEDLQKANKEQKDAFDNQTKALRLDTAIKLAIADSAQDADIVSDLIDTNKLILGED